MQTTEGKLKNQKQEEENHILLDLGGTWEWCRRVDDMKYFWEAPDMPCGLII